MSRYLCYLRVSTEAQADSKNGLEAQRASCLAYVEAQGAAVHAFYVDAGLSGAAPPSRRPQLLAALAELQCADELVVAKRDRLARDVDVMAPIRAVVRKRRARIVSAAGEGTDQQGPYGLLMSRMMDAFAEHERLIIGMRTRQALQAKKARGERVGHIPYGCCLAADGSHLEEDFDEQEVLELMRSLRRAGRSYRAIADELNEVLLLNRHGRPWNKQNVWTILNRTV